MGLDRLTKPQLMELLKEQKIKINENEKRFRDYIDEHISNGFLKKKLVPDQKMN